MTITKSSIKVMVDMGKFKLVPKQAQRICLFFRKALITPKLPKLISTIDAHSV